MKIKHYPGHQQALIKDNIVISVIAFNKHNRFKIFTTLKRFDYDFVVDLCRVQKPASIGDSWDGKKFNERIYTSWTLGEDLNWHPPVPKPQIDGIFWWDEEELDWIEIDPECGCPK